MAFTSISRCDAEVAMDLEPLALMAHLEGPEKLKARQKAAAEGSEFHRRLQQLDRVMAPYVDQERS